MNFNSRLSASLRAIAAPALLLFASPAWASDTANADSAAVVLDGFQLQNVEPLQFGRIIPTGLGGSVNLDANNGVVTTIGQVAIVGTDQTRARFTVKAPVGTIMILAGDPSVVLTRNGGSETMTAALIHRGGTGLVGTFVFGLPIGLRAITADQEIYTGGTLNVAGSQLDGIYEGSFSLMVAYL